MAEQRRFLDVWIIESNTVYREVPFTVVADWIQQARLLPDDRTRPSGTAQWNLIGSTSELAAYVPRVEPHRADDQAEALEPVQMDFSWKARAEDEDEDVDMIPLIDISLVLLIFFMMTSTVAVAAMRGDVPEVQHGSDLLGDPDMFWIGIEKNNKGQPVYSIGQGERGAEKQDRELTQEAVLAKLDERIKGKHVDVRITADRMLPRKIIKDLTIELGKRQGSPAVPQGVHKIYAEVAEQQAE